MTGSKQWPQRDRERRETVERYHRLKDVEEDFVIAKAAAKTREERQPLMDQMYAYRRKHREGDVERGKRPTGLGVSVQMRKIMRARWIEIAVEHELAAREAYRQILAGRTEGLVEELRQSLVAITASASTLESLYEDVGYLIPSRNAGDRRHASRRRSRSRSDQTWDSRARRVRICVGCLHDATRRSIRTRNPSHPEAIRRA